MKENSTQNKKRKKTRPGILIYFELAEPLKKLNFTQKGKILDAMLSYARDGIVPRFDGKLAVMWGFLQPKLDRDQEEYEQAVRRRRFATYCRECRKNGEEPMAFELWLERQDASMMINDDQWYPTTASTATTTSKTKTKTMSMSNKTATATAAASGASHTLGEAELEAIRRMLDEE